MNTVLEMTDVSLRGKKRRTLDHVSLRVREGSLYALAGNRRSGGTELLQAAAGLLRPDSGKIRVCGLDLSVRADRRRLPRAVSYMAEVSGLDPDLTVQETLEFFAHTYGITGLSGRERAVRLLQDTEMERLADERIGSLPLSVRRKLDLVRTMVQRPKLLLLDRPFAGMDRRELESSHILLRQAAAEGVTVVYTADTMASCMNFCTELTVLSGGRPAGAGTAPEIAKRFRERSPIYMEVESGAEIVRRVLSEEENVHSVMEDGKMFRFDFSGSPLDESELLCTLLESGAVIPSFQRRLSGAEETIWEQRDSGMIFGEDGDAADEDGSGLNEAAGEAEQKKEDGE
ncbi:MAG: ATP-binding cassette domain-containing protein [Lachnospiraceae bacterium]|jgi:ABC-2 type transport system ATP-binding protein